MILSDLDILANVKNGLIKIEPFDEARLNPNSYNLRLDDKLLVYDEECLDVSKEPTTRDLYIDATEGLLLIPGQLYLGSTIEFTDTVEFVPMIEGRSSLARLGLFVHVTGGFGDVGFRGRWTLELTVVRPLIIRRGLEICQIFYHAVSSTPLRGYSGKYQDAFTVQPSKLHKEFAHDAG